MFARSAGHLSSAGPNWIEKNRIVEENHWRVKKNHQIEEFVWFSSWDENEEEEEDSSTDR